MDVHQCIQTRRSTRKFKQDSIPQEKLEKVLTAIQWAPSWVNFQPWEVVVVTSEEIKSRLQDCIPSSNPGRNAIITAPIVLAFCGHLRKSGFYGDQPATLYGDWIMFDMGIACQNACLAAWAEGLGSLHLGLLDHAKAGSVLGLPDDVKLYELIPIGFPAKESQPPPRRKPAEFIHKDRY